LGQVQLDMRLLAAARDLLNTSTLINATGGIDVYVDRAGNIIGSDGRTIDYSRIVDNIGGLYRAVAVQLTGSQNSTKTHTYASDFAFSFKLGPNRSTSLLVFGTYDQLKQVNTPGINGRTYLVSSLASLAKIGVDVVGTVPRIWLYPFEPRNHCGHSPETVIANATSSSGQNTTYQTNDQYSYGAMERMSLADQARLPGGRHPVHQHRVGESDGHRGRGDHQR